MRLQLYRLKVLSLVAFSPYKKSLCLSSILSLSHNVFNAAKDCVNLGFRFQNNYNGKETTSSIQ